MSSFLDRTGQLLDAYFDHEASSGEQVEAQELLDASSAHRRYLDDLRAIRRQLKALPASRLDEQFSQRVLDQIHDRIATRPARLSSASSRSTLHGPSAAELTSHI